MSSETDGPVRVRIVAPISYETQIYRIERWSTGDPFPRDLYDVTPEQYARWTAAWAAWEACEEEMATVRRDKTQPDLNDHRAIHDWRKRNGKTWCVDCRTTFTSQEQQ